MKKKYGKLFQNIDKLISKEATELQDWTNLKLLFKFLEGHLKMMINKEVKKPSHFKKVSPPVNMAFNSNKPVKVEAEVEEEKIESRSYPVMQKYEEEKFSPDDFYQEEQTQSCEQCSKKLRPEDFEGENVVMLDCVHYFHKDCLKKSVKKQYLDHKTV